MVFSSKFNHHFSNENFNKRTLQATQSGGPAPSKTSSKKYLSAKLSDSTTSSSSSPASKRRLSAKRSLDSICAKYESRNVKSDQRQQPTRASPKLPIALSTAKLLRRHGMQQRPPPMDVREAFRLDRNHQER